MPIKQGPRDAFRNKYTDETNAIKWPRDEGKRVDIGQTLLGLKFVGSSDYWFEFARDVITNPQPESPYVRPWNQAAKKDRAYREAFSTLNDEQKQAVLRLIRNVVDGATFSSLVHLDQFPHADVVVQLRSRDGEPPYLVQVVPGNLGIGIHERWHEWITDFSSRNEAEARNEVD